MSKPFTRFALVVLAAVAAAACSEVETSIGGPDDEPNMDIFVEVPQASPNVSRSPNFAIQLDDGDQELRIAEVQIVIDDLELRRGPGDCPEGRDDDDPCDEILQDPSLLRLPLDQGDGRLVRVPVTAGSFTGLDLDFHLATEQDTDIVGSNPGLLGHSVAVEAFFNGAPSTVELAPDAELELAFPEAVQLEPGNVGRVTLVVDVASWFQEDDGTLVNPSAAAEDDTLAAEIRTRIEESLSVQLGPPE